MVQILLMEVFHNATQRNAVLNVHGFLDRLEASTKMTLEERVTQVFKLYVT